MRFAVLRLGRFCESLYSTFSTINYPDVVIRITMSMSRISSALFLLADHIVWIGRVGILKVDIGKWTSISNRYWLMMLIMNLTRDFYEILQILKDCRTNLLWNRTSKSGLLKYYGQVCSHLKYRTDVISDTIKNGCDIFIPLTALGYTKLSPGTVGILGVISSLVGIYTLIYPTTKLVPS